MPGPLGRPGGPGYGLVLEPKILDHVALWVGERDRIADFVTQHLGMHVIERTDTFTLVGADARRSKLTLFDAEGPRERGALRHIAFRVNDLAAALGELPEDWPAEREHGGVYFDVYEGLRLGLVEGETESDYDFDHVALFSPLPETTAETWRAYGFAPAAARARCAARRAVRRVPRALARGRGRRRAAAAQPPRACSSTLPTGTSRRPTSAGSTSRTSSTRRTPTPRS